MNKLFTKIAKIFLGLSMAVGVGVAVGAGKTGAGQVNASDSGLTPSAGTFIIDFYDSGKLSSTSGTGLTNNNYSSFVKVATGLTKTNVVTSVSVTGTVRYGMNGGLTAGNGTASSDSTHYVTFNIGSDYAVNRCSVYATAYETGRWKLNGSAAGEGSLGSKGATFDKVTSPLVWNNLGGITSLTFKKDNGSNGTQKRLTIYTIVCEYTAGSSDYVGSLSVSPSTWTGYDSQTLSVSSFTVSGSKNGTAGDVTSSDYEYKGIGYMSGDNFVARDANFSSGNPTTADKRLAWKAKYPTTAGGSTYAWAYVTLTVTADSVKSLAITGSMTNTTYTQGDAWDPTGFTVNAFYASAPSTPVDVTSNANLSWTYSPATAASTSTTSITCTASFGGESATSSAQSVTVNEKQNLGGIISGEKYFIIATYGSTEYYLKSFNSTDPVYDSAAEWPGDNNAPTSDTDAWTFTSTATDDCWSVTNNDQNTLYSIADNNGLRCGTSQHVWQLTSTSNGIKMYNTSQSAKGKYLTIYEGTNWRTYSATSQANPVRPEACSTIRFVKYVAPASITSVEFTGDMTKTTYYVGDSWDYSGLSLQGNKSDTTSVDLGTVNALLDSGDLDIEADPDSPALEVTSVTIYGIYGSALLEAEIEITGITVSTPRSLTGVALNGDMDNKSYSAGDAWNVTGLYLTLTYNVGDPETVQLSTLTKDTDYSFAHDTAVVGDTSIAISGSYSGFAFNKTVTGITVSAVPGRINFGTSSGYWNPTESGATTTDNLGNTVEITSNSGAAYSQQGSDYKQVGTNNNKASEVTITITLQEKSGIDALSIKYSGAASRSNHSVAVYGDNVDDVILNGSISGTTVHEQETDQTYTKINATVITVKFTANVDDCGGIKIFYISYTLGAQVQEFGTLSSIEVSSSSLHNTLFEVDHTFSTEGLIITATDTVGFKKDFTTGFTTDYDGVTFDETAENVEVTVTMTIGLVTRTTSYYINVIEIPSYSLASSQNDLYEGMSVLIAYVSGESVYTAGSLAGSYLNEVDGSVDGDDIRAGEGSYEFVVEYYGSNILLRHGANYIKHNGDKSITLTSTIDANCVWSYDGEKLQNVANSTYFLQYNSGSPRFTDYTGSQNDVGLYISSATPKSDLMGATTYAQKYLHMRDYTSGDGSCMNDSESHYYSTAKTAFGSLTADEKTAFAGLTEAVARLQAWARANGETFDPSAKTFSANKNILPVLLNQNSNTVAIIVIISMVSVTAIGGYFFLRKRKENI